MNDTSIPRALTIAGSDSGGGAGIQADLKTFTALGVYGASAITCVTAQNTRCVAAVHDLPADLVALQIDLVAQDIGVDAAKTGMLSNAAIVQAVAESVRRNRIEKLVVDPVMIAKSGDALLQADARETLVRDLLPLAYVVTPNLYEAEVLSGKPATTIAAMREAARTIRGLGPRHVVIKGGHLDAAEAIDVWFDGQAFQTLAVARVPTRNTHGTGCTYSAAIAAYLAKGCDAFTAVERAKTYLTEAIKRALPLGSGHGPLNHFWPLEESRR